MDRAVEQLLRREAALDEATTDISFDAPDRTWGAGRTRPTVNCFLWEIVRNPSYLTAGIQRRVSSEGAIERRQAPPVVDLHYVVTAWASEYRDEHQLLAAVLRSILVNRRLPADLLPTDLAESRCGVSLAHHDKHVPGEFWSALIGGIRPGLQLEISLPMEVFEWQPTAAVAESVGVATSPIEREPRSPSTAQPGALRRHRSGGSLVMEGRPDGDAGARPGAEG